MEVIKNFKLLFTNPSKFYDELEKYLMDNITNNNSYQFFIIVSTLILFLINCFLIFIVDLKIENLKIFNISFLVIGILWSVVFYFFDKKDKIKNKNH